MSSLEGGCPSSDFYFEPCFPSVKWKQWRLAEGALGREVLLVKRDSKQSSWPCML